MPLVGFICPLSDESVPFEHCRKHCTHHCHPLPVLLALVDERKSEDNVWSVTELLNPPKVTIYKRRYSYYIKPMGLIFSTFGTAWHLMVSQTASRLKQLGVKQDYLFEEENYFEVSIKTPHGVVRLRGTPDLYLPNSKILYDFKTTKYYFTIKYILEKGWEGADSTYHWQINMYRYWKYPETKEMYLYALIKDWNRRLSGTVDEIVNLKVPFIRDDKVKKLTHSMLEELQECQVEELIPRPCERKDLWVQKDGKTRLRCKEYCVVNTHCEEYQEYMNEGG